MQLQAGEGGGLITPEDRDGMLETVRNAYRSLGAGDRLDYVLHPLDDQVFFCSLWQGLCLPLKA